MKKLFAIAALAVLVVGQSGCSSCNRRPLFSWFNRGDNCAPQASAPVGCAPGVGGYQMQGYAPDFGPGYVGGGQPMVLPGPIEVAPLQQ